LEGCLAFTLLLNFVQFAGSCTTQESVFVLAFSCHTSFTATEQQQLTSHSFGLA
jgi:hypothetical protein